MNSSFPPKYERDGSPEQKHGPVSVSEHLLRSKSKSSPSSLYSDPTLQSRFEGFSTKKDLPRLTLQSVLFIDTRTFTD